ncbi:G-D-S-L family lipolytic protein [Flavobacteriaceae bacterium GSB9]|nr:G-D-S-L family lipolytic protein [Flavobacteriaceae bacterium GSB9]
MKYIKYILLSTLFIGLASCEEDDSSMVTEEQLPELTAGSANFSTYIALGNSLTAGFTDGALFMASQENSIPNLLSQKFTMVGGGDFVQPLMNDNFGGIAIGGNRLPGFNPRLVFGGAGPVPLESVIGPVTVTTDLVSNNPSGPFNNMGVPGAKSFHLLAPGYGNIDNVSLGLANPYFVRMASAPNASVIEDAMAQAPTFFTLWIGNNDVLGYATSGGESNPESEDYNPITPVDGPPGVGFNQTYGALIATLTSQGAQGAVVNIPNVTDIPHFTTVPYNPIPLDAATAGAVNHAYAEYNGGLQLALANSLITAEEATARTISFTASQNNAVVIEDESLTNLSGLGLPSIRQATANDLFVLPAASFIGTEAVSGNPLTVNGVAVPLADKWVLIPSEQAEIKTAIDTFNATIKAAATQAGLAFVDANALLNQLANGGITSNNFNLNSSLVFGGAFSLDGVHPTARGYALVANEFLKAIDTTYGSNFEASGNFLDIGNYPTNYSPTLQ